MTVHDLAAALNGSVNNDWINIRAPGHSAKDRSLGFKLDPKAPDGFWVKPLDPGDDQALCRKHVLALLKKVANGAVLNVEPQAAADEQGARRNARALALWGEGQQAKGSIVEAYLAARGCDLSAIQADVIRFHPHCPFGKDRVPAMLALVQNVITATPQGILRTALQDDGSGKRVMPDGTPGKAMLGAAKGGAVMLQPHAPRMGIAEGLETAMSAQHIFGPTVWATMSAGGVASFPVIHSLQHLTIFADHDEAGLCAAVECGHRYKKAGIEVEVRYPPTSGSDWNDYLIKEHL